MSQTKKVSFIEAVINTAVGFIITMIASVFIYPMCGVIISLDKMTLVTIAFTVVSVLRQYVIRRLFNKLEK